MIPLHGLRKGRRWLHSVHKINFTRQNFSELTLFLITGSTDQTYCMNGGPKIAEKLVKTWCNAKRRCYLEANRRLFGGPCDHHRQALRVAYECVMANLCKFLNFKGPQISQPSQYSFWKLSHTLNDRVEIGFVLFWLVLFRFDLVSFVCFHRIDLIILIWFHLHIAGSSVDFTFSEDASACTWFCQTFWHVCIIK